MPSETKSRELSRCQVCCLEAVRRGLNGQASTFDVAHRVRRNNLAVTSSLRSLEKKGLIGQFTTEGQWGSRIWFIRRESPATPSASPATQTDPKVGGTDAE